MARSRIGLLSLLAAGCLALASCNTLSTTTGGSVASTPAPVADAVTTALGTLDTATTVCNQTKTDEVVLKGLWSSFDVLLTYVDGQHLTYGSPKAVSERKALIKIRSGLEALTAVHGACSSGSWVSSIASLRSAFTDARAVLN